MRLRFEPAAADSYQDVVDEELLDGLDAVFDELEKNPGQASLRRHRWSDPPVWGVAIRSRREELLVLWSMETFDGEQTVVVRYIGLGIPD
jgi:hypothetical protein